MPISIKSKAAFKNLKKTVFRAGEEAIGALEADLGTIILDNIEAGKSPVKGTNRYAKYKTRTAKKKGRVSPVTLFERGLLYLSLEVELKKSNLLRLSFGNDDVKYAKYIHEGTKDMKARPLLPTNGRSFKVTIVKQMQRIIDRAVRRALRK